MPELCWASKKPIAPLSAALRTEGVVYPRGRGYPTAEAVNRLILGDNLAVMSALLPEYVGRINLIYADPPFYTNRRYPARIGRGEDSRRPQEWQLAEGYPDHWPNLDAYLDMLYPRLILMHRLLAPSGSLYLHLDWHANAYARLLLDEIFGPDRLLNEIIWVYHGPSPIRSAFNRKHDTILAYTKSARYTFNADAVRQPYDASTVKAFAATPKAGFGKKPNLERGKVPEDWWYFPVVARLHRERTGYPTQKPQALLERILLASSNPGDLVADFFAGSGTLAVVAARLGRRYIASDVTPRAVQTMHARLASETDAPFKLQIGQVDGDAPRGDAPGSFADELSPALISLAVVDAHHMSVTLDASLLADLDLWEVDPAWDGGIFRSAVQVARSRRERLAAAKAVAPLLTDSAPVCIRLYFAGGEKAQVVLPKPVG